MSSALFSTVCAADLTFVDLVLYERGVERAFQGKYVQAIKQSAEVGNACLDGMLEKIQDDHAYVITVAT